ncbi:MAG: bacillithiol biosynthesis deacetylase BshB1 [Bacteroidota bacterium]
MKLDMLAIAAHPDDIELSCSGTLLTHLDKGKKVGVLDLTRGEMGTRGTPETRMEEAEASSKILGLTVRLNLGFEDAFFKNDLDHQLKIIKVIREYQPAVVLANAVRDRHPDHGKAADLVRTACFLSGLKKVETDINGEAQTAWRPKNVFHYIQSVHLQPDFIVDVSPFWEKRMDSVRAFKSQFHDPNNSEPDTYISSPEFMKMIEARGKEFGHAIGVNYGEGFMVNRPIGVSSMFDLI